MNPVLQCDQDRACEKPVTMIDNKGYVYCTEHGLSRRQCVCPCRKLRPSEVRRLQSGNPLRKY